MVEPRRSMGCSLIGLALWRGREARSTDETGTRGRRREAGETTGLSSGRYVTLFTVFTTTYVSLLYSC